MSEPASIVEPVITKRNLAKKTHEMLVSLAERDPLTGLLNRRGFDRELETAYAHVQRSGENLSLLFIDADNFKGVNARYGRLGGDKVLKSIAEAMRNTFRAEDRLARWGGDEFVVIREAEIQKHELDEDSLQHRLNNNLNSIKPSEIDGNVSVTVGIHKWDGVMKLDQFQQEVQDRMDARK